jgi:hypothetical protein
MRHAVGWGAGEALRLKLNTPLAVASALMDSCLRSLQADLANAQAEVRCIPSLAFHRRFASLNRDRTTQTRFMGKHTPTNERRFRELGSMRISCDTLTWLLAHAHGHR